MQKRRQQDEILNLGHAIALQAVELPPHERQGVIKREIANIRQIYATVYPDEGLLESMEEWVTELVKILAGNDSPEMGNPPE
jgi:acyl-[acyl carrier protein]--UDP-N-acetylglucosamine O-acyltransferase